MAIALPVDSDSEAASKRRRGCRVPWPPGALWHPFPSPAGPGSTARPETFAPRIVPAASAYSGALPAGTPDSDSGDFPFGPASRAPPGI